MTANNSLFLLVGEMNRNNFNTVLLYFLCLVVIYQQYAIYKLQSAVATQSVVSISPATNVNVKVHSPPPVVPVYQLRSNEDRSVGGKGGKSIYGGVGDEVHLGGFTQRDNDTISENLWNYMLGPLAVKSFLDIGCGRGFSSKFFMDRGARVLCIEGSHDALNHTLLPHSVIVQHDYSKGKWWPEETFDVAYSTEFVEHVGRQYIPNYMATMKKAALVLFTSSTWGGYHHVEVHDRTWWIARFQAHGFIYSAELSKALSDEVSYVLSNLQFIISCFIRYCGERRFLVVMVNYCWV